MAKQRFGINDGFRGTVGTVIGYQWRGKWCLRARPRSVRNPRTERQQNNRVLFKEVVRYAANVKQVLRIGLHDRAMEAHMTECNYFFRLNSDCFTNGEGGLEVDYTRLIVSEGPVAPVGFGGVQEEDGVVTIPFEKNPLHMRAESEDEVYLFALCPSLDARLLSAPVYRRSKSISMVLPDEWQGREVHLYGFVANYAGRASHSVYLGFGVLGEVDSREGLRGLEDTTYVNGIDSYKKDLAMSSKSRIFASHFESQANGLAHQGEMAERSIAAVLKTVDLRGSGGSNPSLSAS